MLAPGALLLGNAGSTYECSFEHSRGDRCISFNYTPECIEETLEGLPAAKRIEFRTHRIPPIPEILPLAARTAMQTVVQDVALWEELSLAIAGDVFAVLSGDTRSNGRQINRSEGRISDALQVIETRYAEPLSVAELASIGMREFPIISCGPFVMPWALRLISTCSGRGFGMSPLIWARRMSRYPRSHSTPVSEISPRLRKCSVASSISVLVNTEKRSTQGGCGSPLPVLGQCAGPRGRNA